MFSSLKYYFKCPFCSKRQLQLSIHLITKTVSYFQIIPPEYKYQIKTLSTNQCALNKLTQFYSKTHTSPHIFAFHHFITNAIMFIARALSRYFFLFLFSTNDQITSGEVVRHVTEQIDILPPFSPLS